MKTILFVCIENSCRSQIAEVYANLYSESKFQIFSAGSKPSGSINPTAIKLMAELGHKMTNHYSKSIDKVSQNVDFLVTMGCGDYCPNVNAKERIEWDIPDPKHMNMKDFKQVVSLIDNHVFNLIKSII